jgi:hypothetical protein
MLIEYKLNQTIVDPGPLAASTDEVAVAINPQGAHGITPFPILGIYDINPSSSNCGFSNSNIDLTLGPSEKRQYLYLEPNARYIVYYRPELTRGGLMEGRN